MSTRRDIEAAMGRRVYEYVGTNGVTYYSLTRAPNTLTTVQLRLVGRLGQHVLNFMTRLRVLSGTPDADDDG